MARERQEQSNPELAFVRALGQSLQGFADGQGTEPVGALDDKQKFYKVSEGKEVKDLPKVKFER